MSSLRISRRTVLRGLGTALTLPWLEAMQAPLSLAAQAGGKNPGNPVRMAFLYVPNGVHMPDWTPSTEGEGFELPKLLTPLAKLQADVTVVSGLTLNGARALGDGGGDHARSVAAFLTGAHPKKTSGADIKNGVSVDQVAAEQIGKLTKLPSLELGLERSAQAGNCDSGYSCVYTSNMSWRSETSPVAKEIDPAAVFDRLFGNQKSAEEQQGREKRRQRRASILDYVLEDARSLQRKLGAADLKKLDEYLYAVRDIERRIVSADKLRQSEADVPDYPRPAGVPREFEEHLRLMFDLMVLALQTDSTRVMSFMYTNAGSNRSYPDIGVNEGHHNLSHHGNDAAKQRKISKINQYHISQFAYLLEKLAATREGEGRLLDQCMILYGSGIGDGNRHNHEDLPILLCGRGGEIRSGRHIRYPKETPLTNLYLSMLDRMNVKIKSIGDSSKRLPNLS